MRLFILATAAVITGFSLTAIADDSKKDFPSTDTFYVVDGRLKTEPLSEKVCGDDFGRLVTTEEVYAMSIEVFCVGLQEALEYETIPDVSYYGLADGWAISQPNTSGFCSVEQKAVTDANICTALSEPPKETVFGFESTEYTGVGPFLGKPHVVKAGEHLSSALIMSFKVGTHAVAQAFEDSHFSGDNRTFYMSTPATDWLVRSVKVKRASH